MATKRVTVIVATHKQYEMPKDAMYLPLHVGAAGASQDLGYTRDDTGDNISRKNYCFGTQTGLYWAWKHVDADYIGLVHYRRHFVVGKVNKADVLGSVLASAQLEPMLGKYRVFVPKKRRYYIETVYSHYAHTLDGSQLDIARAVIQEKSPEYLPAFDRVMKRTGAHMFNLMILEKALLHDYCAWLFPVLFGVEEHVDQTNMTDFEKRFCGRISELMFNVWLEHNVMTGKIAPQEIKELAFTEDVNWANKIKGFLAAKFLHKKYGASF